MEQGYINKFKIELMNTDKIIKVCYTDTELKILLKKPNKNCSFVEYRNWVISNYFVGTGNRRSTVCNIKISDLDLDNGIVLLRRTKNRKQQIFPLSHTLILILATYLKYRKGKEEDYLFCNSYGKQLTPAGLDNAIRDYNKSRGISKTSMHLYRHAFAKNWIMNRWGYIYA